MQQAHLVVLRIRLQVAAGGALAWPGAAVRHGAVSLWQTVVTVPEPYRYGLRQLSLYFATRTVVANFWGSGGVRIEVLRCSGPCCTMVAVLCVVSGCVHAAAGLQCARESVAAAAAADAACVTCAQRALYLLVCVKGVCGCCTAEQFDVA